MNKNMVWSELWLKNKDIFYEKTNVLSLLDSIRNVCKIFKMVLHTKMWFYKVRVKKCNNFAYFLRGFVIVIYVLGPFCFVIVNFISNKKNNNNKMQILFKTIKMQIICWYTQKNWNSKQSNICEIRANCKQAEALVVITGLAKRNIAYTLCLLG